MNMQTIARTSFGHTALPPRPWSFPFRRWLQVARERRQLAKLTPELMRDIGIDPIEARREASRHFWDVPAARQ